MFDGHDAGAHHSVPTYALSTSTDSEALGHPS